MTNEIVEHVLLGGVIVGLGLIGKKLYEIDEKLDREFNKDDGYYTLKEANKRWNEKFGLPDEKED